MKRLILILLAVVSLSSVSSAQIAGKREAATDTLPAAIVPVQGDINIFTYYPLVPKFRDMWSRGCETQLVRVTRGENTVWYIELNFLGTKRYVSLKDAKDFLKRIQGMNDYLATVNLNDPSCIEQIFIGPDGTKLYFRTDVTHKDGTNKTSQRWELLPASAPAQASLDLRTPEELVNMFTKAVDESTRLSK